MIPSLSRLRQAVACAESLPGIELYPYQVEGAAWCLRRSTLLAFDPGLGKTITVLASLPLDQTAYLVVPKVALGVWLQEIGRYTNQTQVVLASGARRPKAELVQLDGGGRIVSEQPCSDFSGRWVVLTHESVVPWATISLMSQGSPIVAGRFNFEDIEGVHAPPPLTLIVDEIHRFGGHRSQRTQALLALGVECPRVIALTGTPLLGGSHRLWAPLQMIAPRERWGSWFDFVERYAAGVPRTVTPTGREPVQTMVPTGLSREGELRERLAPYLLRYTRAQAAAHLPAETRQKVPIWVRGSNRALTKAGDCLMKELRGRSGQQPGSRFEQGEVLEALTTVARVKVPYVVEHVKELVESGERVVVWVWFHATSRELYAGLHAAGVPSYTATGEVFDDELERNIRAWSQRPSVLIAGMAKIGEAISVLADHCCHQDFLELPWLPEVLDQAAARLVRQNQKRPVSTRVLVLQIPFEQSLEQRLEQRQAESREVIG